MKLSEQTVSLLSNFASINQNLQFKSGNKISTISPQKNILVKAEIPESFPSDFAIYDLSQFLGGLSLFNDPQLEFTSKDFVNIKGGRNSAKYYFSDPEITLKSAPEKNVKFPGSDLEFTLSGEDLYSLQKASAVYSLPDLTFVAIEGEDTIKLVLRDKENDTSNTYDLTLKGSSTGSYSLDVKIENLRIMSGDYKVKVSKGLISEWVHQNIDLTYYIALEP